MSDAAGNGQGKTLWEMLTERLNKSNAPLPFQNPLDLRIGAVVPVSRTHREFQDYDFYVREIREYTRKIGAQPFTFVDYVLRGTNTKTFDKDAEVLLRLRAVPNAAGGHDNLLLRLYDELAFDQGFLEVVNDATGLFEVTDDESGQTEQYSRINGLKDPYESVVMIVTATTDDGKAPPKQLKTEKLQYWDYWRDVPVAGSEKTKKQFLFIEMHGETGWFQIWHGEEFFL